MSRPGTDPRRGGRLYVPPTPVTILEPSRLPRGGPRPPPSLAVRLADLEVQVGELTETLTSVIGRLETVIDQVAGLQATWEELPPPPPPGPLLPPPPPQPFPLPPPPPPAGPPPVLYNRDHCPCQPPCPRYDPCPVCCNYGLRCQEDDLTESSSEETESMAPCALHPPGGDQEDRIVRRVVEAIQGIVGTGLPPVSSDYIASYNCDGQRSAESTESWTPSATSTWTPSTVTASTTCYCGPEETPISDTETPLISDAQSSDDDPPPQQSPRAHSLPARRGSI